jgi:hypothetical protein
VVPHGYSAGGELLCSTDSVALRCCDKVGFATKVADRHTQLKRDRETEIQETERQRDRETERQRDREIGGGGGGLLDHPPIRSVILQ